MYLKVGVSSDNCVDPILFNFPKIFKDAILSKHLKVGTINYTNYFLLIMIYLGNKQKLMS